MRTIIRLAIIAAIVFSACSRGIDLPISMPDTTAVTDKVTETVGNIDVDAASERISTTIGTIKTAIEGFDQPDAAGTTVEVSDVTDGDTFVTTSGEKIRLLGVNTPESDECGGTEAGAFLEMLIGGRNVTLVVGDPAIDQYGRTLAWVLSAGGVVNVALAEAGLGLPYQYDQPHTVFMAEVDAAAARARESRAGLWGAMACGGTAVDASNLSITVSPDAPGDDGANPNGEYAVITNHGSETVNLSGWVLRDESSSHRYTFGTARIDAGGTIVVYSGCGTDEAAAVFWCDGGAIWNNSGDVAYLLDPSGNIVVTYSY